MAIDRKKFFDGVRAHPFNGNLTQGQVDGINSILDEWEKRGLTDMRWLAYILATTKWETASTMQPIAEYGHGRGRAYGSPTGPWHQAYYGRGDVQLTWEANYAHATKRLRELGVIGADIDLEKTPDLAMRPDIAAAIMFYGMIEGWFTGKKLSDYLNDERPTDFVSSRRIINGLDRANDIAAFAKQFLSALTVATA